MKKIRNLAGHKFEPSLWLKCQRCDRLVESTSSWLAWWLVAPRAMRDKRTKYIIRCPQHVTRRAMMTARAPGQRSKGFRIWREMAVEHYDDDEQPPEWLEIIFPNESEYELFTSQPLSTRW